jgi:hypothetical protein
MHWDLTRNSENITADHIVLATSAGTAKLLADSALNRSEPELDGHLVAGAMVTGIKNGRRDIEIPATVYSVPPIRDKAAEVLRVL